MSLWGIDRHRIAAALGAVRPAGAEEWADDDGSRDGAELDEPGVLDELFARAIWSVLVEPGDSVAGALIAAVGPVAAARLVIDRVGPATIVEATRGEITEERARDGLLRWTERLRASDVMRSLESAARSRATMITPGDAHWPERLVALRDSQPMLLWARGDLELLRRPGVALVGARAATGYGEHVAMELAAGLCARDVVVVSGGAYGIDGMAHRAALASGGATIAVLAGGIDRLYPSGHEALLTRVAEQGLLLSEVPCGAAPTKWRFLQRNRLIAALSAATVVVEAGRRSGALNTANHALDAGLPVGVVPGPVTSAASAGCHALLRTGPVECVTSVAEVMQLAFGSDGVLHIPEPVEPHTMTEPAPGEVPRVHRADPLQGRVIDALRPRRGQSPSDLAREVGEGADRIRAVLGVLDLEGLASLGADGLWRRVVGASSGPG
ncbi:MAG: DNA-processing protein DprA, partial [Microbacteriaceae bacterium]|nr:DNA-processing protein DprA [Microbacteriaceae bacterium]